ncbi:DUF4136 domain-containing protein [Allomuricauda sp. SCSIO 65647]|uniref:DUF4136 domain-containing protein n=1 Tax=Allomuricauda sp. SCSIO 65647 TaxID=2908843 RepID=UPI001F2D1E2E|nr:DUF4136 domain-containing protein [Muricauda sp. SCSIO 65647]UJH66591.1 DUF4136 domain-containing protein [Muricauda sp. SCSIO 65647]
MKTRIINWVVVIVPALLLMVSCNSIKNLQTVVEYDKEANFNSYSSYKFLNEVSVSDTHDNYSTENKRTFENSIHEQLKNKGLEETETPDLYINFFVLDSHESKSITRTTYRDQQYGGMTHLDTYIKEYEQGTLIIDIVDASTKNLVWRGLATGVITGKQEDMQKTIDEAVRAIVSKYPPKV